MAFLPTFVKISEHISYLKMPTNAGLIAVDGENGTKDIYIIDTGNTDTSGEAILNAISEHYDSWRVKAILNTHAHADHFGGNPLIMRRTGCEVWTSRGESALMEYPSLQTQLIWGGTPILEIRSKFLYGTPCKVSRFLGDGEILDLNGVKVEIISLPGHYVDPIGFLITDTDGTKSFFVGDTLSGRNVIKTYWIQYLLDERKSKESITKISKIKADIYIPGHGDAANAVEGITELNMIAILETENMILDELKTPKTMEELLKRVAERNNLDMKASQYCLIGSTLRSYLSSLEEAGRIFVTLSGNRMLWQKTPDAADPQA